MNQVNKQFGNRLPNYTNKIIDLISQKLHLLRKYNFLSIERR